VNTQQQKVALITGASQGLGAGIVDAYRKLGYDVVATSRTIAPAADPGILTVQGDIADRATAERVVAAGVERFGRIDTLVNNAGIFVAKPFTDYTQDDYATVTGVNLAGFFRITQLAIERMLAQGGGHIVNITTSLVDNADALHPVGRMGETSDIAEAVIFLENASFVTGEILHVDGGMSAGH
jgi:NAD(P)-dependent dehydrogenase (short-subunit alcohol dehydrogenase family)